MNKEIEEIFEKNRDGEDWGNWIIIEALKIYLSTQSDELKLEALNIISSFINPE